MGTLYALKIFVPCRLKNGFYPLHFMAAILSHRRDSSLLPSQPAKHLCATCVMFLFGTEFGLCVLLCDVQAAFLGRFTALKSSLHLLSVKRTKAVEEALNRWARRALDDEMPGDFLAALAKVFKHCA